MSQSLGRLRLIDLPSDVFQLIIELLLPDDFLFTPYYDDELYDNLVSSGLDKKCTEYYGTTLQRKVEYAQGLLNLSCTCRHLRIIAAPWVFRSVILRNSPKSMASIEALSRSSYWTQIQQLIFVSAPERGPKSWNSGGGGQQQQGAEESLGEIDSNDSRMEENVERDMKVAMEKLAAILSQLPPNLNSLTLDFPRSWDNEGQDDYLESSHLDDQKASGYYPTMYKTVMNAVAENDFSTKSKFELNLYNISPHDCPAYETDSWRCFLKEVTSFTLGLCHYDNGAGWNMNRMLCVNDFCPSIGQFFWDHLERTNTIKLFCDNSWPLGECEGLINDLPISLPNTSDGLKLSYLTHVSFAETFICYELIDFLVAHCRTLESIDLRDCYASDGAERSPHWSTLFKRLVEATPSPKSLCRVSVSNPKKELKDLIPFDDKYSQDECRELEDILSRQETQETIELQKGASLEGTKRRNRIVYPYCYIDDKYGMIFDEEEVNLERFLEGADHKEWLKLADLMEANIRRKTDVNLVSEPS